MVVMEGGVFTVNTPESVALPPSGLVTTIERVPVVAVAAIVMLTARRVLTADEIA